MVGGAGGALGGVGELEHPARLFEQRGAGFGEHDAAGGAVEDLDAELDLELADLFADGGLGDVEAFGGAPEVQLLRDGDEVLELSEFHAPNVPSAGGCSHPRSPETDLRLALLRPGEVLGTMLVRCAPRPLLSTPSGVSVVAVRVVIGEDDVLMREGIVRILEGAGMEVVAQTGHADDLLRRAMGHRPDVAVVDIQMPPTNQADGLRAAIELREALPETGVLVLSGHFEESYVVDLIGDHAEGVGYLLKERVGDVSVFIDAVRRVADGGTALDPEVVGRMLGRRRGSGPLDSLSPRERDVLREMAAGKSNLGIAESLVVSEAAVEKHVTSIFRKLGIEPTDMEHRRVLAVLQYVRASRR